MASVDEANRVIREAVAARLAATPPDDHKLGVFWPADLPTEFAAANPTASFRPAEPMQAAEFTTQRVAASMSPEQLEAAWASVKSRRDETLARIRGEAEPIETVIAAGPRADARLIGLTGPAGAGKNLVASMVPDAVVIQLADPIYAGLALMLGVEEQMLRARSTKEQPIEWLNGRSPRQLLQTLGTDWGRRLVADDLWLTLAARRIDQLEHAGAPAVVIADVRFDNEAEMIRERGGEVWRVDRPPAAAAAEHVSEAGISPALIDRVIDNHGTPDATRARVLAILAG